MSVEKLRQSRGGATVAFTMFVSMQKKFQNCLFCSFEGNDSKYYLKRIEDQTGYSASELMVLNCSGKREVLRLYKLINEKKEYKTAKVCYFIDRDFDESVKDEYPGVYETPGYSIENFYTTDDAFVRIVKTELGYTEMDNEFNFLIENFKARQSDFHDKTAPFNVWLCCQRRLSTINKLARIDISSFNLNKLIQWVDLDTVNGECSLNLLMMLFPNAPLIDAEMYQAVYDELKRFNRQMLFRGKFETEFLFSFIEAIKRELQLETSRLAKKPGTYLTVSKGNVISEFGQFANTPACLIRYLKLFSKAA